MPPPKILPKAHADKVALSPDQFALLSGKKAIERELKLHWQEWEHFNAHAGYLVRQVTQAARADKLELRNGQQRAPINPTSFDRAPLRHCQLSKLESLETVCVGASGRYPRFP